MNSTSSRAVPNPLFSHYIRPYIVAFENTKKSSSKSKREFFTKHQVNIFLNEAFSSLDLRVLRLLITSMFDCE